MPAGAKGDAGITEPSAASSRRGVTWANFYRPTPGLSLDLDVSLARARFDGVPAGEDRIPGALENVIAAGVAWSTPERGPFAAVRGKATTLANANAGWLFGSGVRLQVGVHNLFDTRAFDIQYYYTSRLPGEPAAGVDDVHFHPVEPRQVRVSLGWGI